MKDTWGEGHRPTSMTQLIENTRRSNEFVVALRRDAAAAKAVLDQMLIGTPGILGTILTGRECRCDWRRCGRG